jgi:hypothetical protein
VIAVLEIFRVGASNRTLISSNVSLKKHVVMAVPSSLTRYPLFEIYPSTYCLFRKNQKAEKTISKFAETLFIVTYSLHISPCQKINCVTLHCMLTNKSNSLCLCAALYRYSRATNTVPASYTLYKRQQSKQALCAPLTVRQAAGESWRCAQSRCSGVCVPNLNEFPDNSPNCSVFLSSKSS